MAQVLETPKVTTDKNQLL